MEENQLIREDELPVAPLLGIIEGHVVGVTKHRFSVWCKGPDGTVWQLELKRKKLNEKQKALLRVDAKVRLDFSTHKLSFKGDEENYY